MKDSGAQCSFIDEHIANRENFRIIKSDVNLTVNGFNSSKSYKSKLVEVPLTFGNETQNIAAMCVPSISTKMSLPGLGTIVKKFLECGFDLADKRFLDPENDDISDINLILGSNAVHCLPQTDILFGKDSIFSKTKIGIMLSGDMNLTISDFPSVCSTPISSTGVSSSAGVSLADGGSFCNDKEDIFSINTVAFNEWILDI